MRKVLKAEILLTRQCNLRCKYCAIVSPIMDEMNIEGWKRGLDVLKELGCSITPIYGAEPLMVYDKLLEFIKYGSEIDLPNTLITNCTLLTEKRMDELHDAGLRSLTVSVDSLNGGFIDKSTRKRSRVALKCLDYFKKKEMRDLEVVVTLTRQNYSELPNIIRHFSEKGIWTHFDFIHYNKGNPGSKCASREVLKDLLFTYYDMPHVKKVMEEVLELKKQGCLIHPTEKVIKMSMEAKYVVELGWKCDYPGNVTVNSDGRMLICDDFSGFKFPKIMVYELKERWEEFEKEWKRQVSWCTGCFWGTHVMSNQMVKEKGADKYFTHEVYKK